MTICNNRLLSRFFAVFIEKYHNTAIVIIGNTALREGQRNARICDTAVALILENESARFEYPNFLAIHASVPRIVSKLLSIGKIQKPSLDAGKLQSDFWDKEIIINN